MIPYSKFRPSQFDTAGLGLEERQDWLVVDVARNRDSDVLTRHNFATAVEVLGDSEDVEVHRFGHWANGWFEIILVRPGSMAEGAAHEVEAALADYPILGSEDAFQEACQAEAEAVWKDYRVKDRIEYIQRHRSEHEFRTFADLLGCVRGKYFAGDAYGFCAEH